MCEEYSKLRFALLFERKPTKKAETKFILPVLYFSESKLT